MRTKPALVIVQGSDRVRVHSAGFAGYGTAASGPRFGLPESCRFARGLAERLMAGGRWVRRCSSGPRRRTGV
jgi:hypothetical protein